ncbi:MAG: pilus assembly protein [Acidobacteria bacterium]|nr:pilus assembly protein [Acidobacteriota bacterium]
MKTSLSSSRGQSLIEFTMFLPLALVMGLGMIELSYALLDQHVVSKLTREGANLISRNATLEDAGVVMRTMGTRPVNFDDGSTLIFSVLRKVATTDADNYDKVILYQRHSIGSLDANSVFTTEGTGEFAGAPDYQALDSDNDTRLQITNLPASLDVGLGGMVFVTEIYTTHRLITPFNGVFLGGNVPTTLYSIAYF